MTEGTSHSKVWSSTGGTSWSSTYSYNNGTCVNSGLSGPWVANTASGSTNDILNSNNTGCTATIIYTVTNAAGVSASDTLYITAIAP